MSLSSSTSGSNSSTNSSTSTTQKSSSSLSAKSLMSPIYLHSPNDSSTPTQNEPNSPLLFDNSPPNANTDTKRKIEDYSLEKRKRLRTSRKVFSENGTKKQASLDKFFS